MPVPLATDSSRPGYAERTAGLVVFYGKSGLQPDGGKRSGQHEILPIEIHEIRYRMSLDRAGPS
jgi:hypothetical protein